MTLKPSDANWNPPRNEDEIEERRLVEVAETCLDCTTKEKYMKGEIALGELIGFYHGLIARRDALLRAVT